MSDSTLVKYLKYRKARNLTECSKILQASFDYYLFCGKMDSDYIPLVSGNIKDKVAISLYWYFSVEKVLSLIKNKHNRSIVEYYLND